MVKIKRKYKKKTVGRRTKPSTTEALCRLQLQPYNQQQQQKKKLAKLGIKTIREPLKINDSALFLSKAFGVSYAKSKKKKNILDVLCKLLILHFIIIINYKFFYTFFLIR